MSVKHCFSVLVLVFTVFGKCLCQTAKSGFCRDELSYSDCRFYKSMGLCEVGGYRPVLSKKCPLSCNLCTFGLDEKTNCIDKDDSFNCEYLAKHGVCKSHANVMAERCAKTCNLCDARDKCAKKKCFHNEICILNDQRNAECVCPSYCPNQKHYEKLGAVCGTDWKTYDDLCQLQHHSCKVKHNITVYHYGICKGQEPCEDAKAESSRGLCKEWKKAKLCGDPFYGEIMNKYCKKTCGECPDPSKPPNSPLRGECDDRKKSPFGCCWDLSIRPAPPKQCRVCKDRFPNFCQSFLQQCNSSERKNRRFMKTNCPVTCGFCIPETKPKLVIKIYNRSGQRLFTTKFVSQND